MTAPSSATNAFAAWLEEVGPTVEEALVAALDRACAAAPPPLHEPLRHAVLGGGKRVRPALCLLAAEAADGRTADAPCSSLDGSNAPARRGARKSSAHA